MARSTTRAGKSKYPEGQYWPLPYSLAKHPAFQALSGKALKIYIELHCRFTVRGDGTNNNGTLILSITQTEKLLHMGRNTALKAFKELETAGFIVKMKQGQWYGRKATEYRLTDQSYNGQVSMRDWQRIWLEKQNTVPKRNTSRVDGSISEPAE